MELQQISKILRGIGARERARQRKNLRSNSAGSEPAKMRLCVSVIAGRNLIARDSNGTPCDVHGAPLCGPLYSWSRSL